MLINEMKLMKINLVILTLCACIKNLKINFSILNSKFQIPNENDHIETNFFPKAIKRYKADVTKMRLQLINVVNPVHHRNGTKAKLKRVESFRLK